MKETQHLHKWRFFLFKWYCKQGLSTPVVFKKMKNDHLSKKNKHL